MARTKDREMAVATEEMTDQTENVGNSNEVQSETPPTTDETAENKSKRERVDPATLAPQEKVTLALTLPAEFVVMLTKAGEEKSLVTSAYARQVLADAFGYTIPESFTERTRSSKYSSEEERIAEQKKRTTQNRENTKKALAALKELNPELAAALGIK